MDKQTFNLLMLTYKTSLKHIKSSIKNGVLTFDLSNNSPGMTNLNGLIQEGSDIEHKIAFLHKHMGYFTNNQDPNTFSKEHKEAVDKARKICKENDSKSNVKSCNETGCSLDNRSCNVKQEVKKEVIDEVIEVNKTDIIKDNMRAEIVNELRVKYIDMFDKVVKK